MVKTTKFEGFPLNSSSPRYATLRVYRESSRNILNLSEDVAKCARVLDGLSGSLCEERDHRVSRVADKRDRPERKGRNRAAVIERPNAPPNRRFHQQPRFFRPPRERALETRTVNGFVLFTISATGRRR
jgi:nucleotidyltransferase/DNA polymerase involved in DNA repair